MGTGKFDFVKLLSLYLLPQVNEILRNVKMQKKKKLVTKVECRIAITLDSFASEENCFLKSGSPM